MRIVERQRWRLAAAQGGITPPQWFGLIERINAYGYMLWMAVLAIILLLAERGGLEKGNN